MQKLNFSLNGQSVAIEAQPGSRLSTVLREQLNFRGTKIGCDAGDCGACSVLLDKQVVCACMVPVGRLDGTEVVTVEGLSSSTPIIERLQSAFHVHGAAQCGICTPGMLISAVALLERNPRPSEQEVENALGGVLCRCTGYRKIVRAVCAAADYVEETLSAQRTQSVGQAVPRLDGVEKISGDELFGDDVAAADCLVLKAVRSPHHRARFEFGDIDSFVSSQPGIISVITAADVPGENAFGVLAAFRDQPVFAVDEARYLGGSGRWRCR